MFVNFVFIPLIIIVVLIVQFNTFFLKSGNYTIQVYFLKGCWTIFTFYLSKKHLIGDIA